MGKLNKPEFVTPAQAGVQLNQQTGSHPGRHDVFPYFIRVNNGMALQVCPALDHKRPARMGAGCPITSIPLFKLRIR
jgi:hypothetical protein